MFEYVKEGKDMTKRVNSNTNEAEQQNKIFISWSGKSSKKIAEVLKDTLENKIFETSDLKCFVSTADIASGEDWWSKIQDELRVCKQGIVCVTKENIRAPWIFFEAGAMVARNVPVIQLLFQCNQMVLGNSPLKGKQCRDFGDQAQFLQMINDINDKMGLLQIGKAQMNAIAKGAYEEMKELLANILDELDYKSPFDEKYIYPNHITTIEKNTLYISAPMSAIDNDEYSILREDVLNLKNDLISLGFRKIYCPLFNIESPEGFDGKIKAIIENFEKMKQVDCMIIIYPKNVPSSILVEIGYGLALSKNVVIFYRDKLPYVLQGADKALTHIKAYKYEKFEEIRKTITKNEMHIFKGGSNE